MKRYCFSCDLKDDPKLISEYKRYHEKENAWPEITKSIKDAGVISMNIYLTGNRMFMIMDTQDSFDPNKKAAMDAQNPKVQEWEALMWTYQQALPWAAEGEKWLQLDSIFSLD